MPAGLTVTVSAVVPLEGIPAFQAYEAAVLPLLKDAGATLERRLRNENGTRELHIVRFPSSSHFERYRADPRRASHSHLLLLSGAQMDVTIMHDVVAEV